MTVWQMLLAGGVAVLVAAVLILVPPRDRPRRGLRDLEDPSPDCDGYCVPPRREEP